MFFLSPTYTKFSKYMSNRMIQVHPVNALKRAQILWIIPRVDVPSLK